jgi:hypothetical protein
MSNTGPTQKLGVNSGAREGKTDPASYKTPAVLLKLDDTFDLKISQLNLQVLKLNSHRQLLIRKEFRLSI